MELMNRRLINRMADKTDFENVKEKVIELLAKTKSTKQQNKQIISAISGRLSGSTQSVNPGMKGPNGKKVNRRMSYTPIPNAGVKGKDDTTLEVQAYLNMLNPNSVEYSSNLQPKKTLKKQTSFSSQMDNNEDLSVSDINAFLEGEIEVEQINQIKNQIKRQGSISMEIQELLSSNNEELKTQTQMADYNFTVSNPTGMKKVVRRSSNCSVNSAVSQKEEIIVEMEKEGDNDSDDESSDDSDGENEVVQKIDGIEGKLQKSVKNLTEQIDHINTQVEDLFKKLNNID